MLGRTLASLGSILVLLSLWWAVSMRASPQVVPGPALIARTIVAILTTPGPEGERAYVHIGITLLRILASFGGAMLAGIGIGLAMGLRRTVEQSLVGLIPLWLTVPTLLVVFLSVLWFGFSEVGGVAAVLVVVTPFVTANIWEGTKAMDKGLIDMATAFGAGRRLLIRSVLLPQLMPYLFSAFRYAFSISWKVVTLAEAFGLKFGIGYMLTFWFEQFRMVQVVAWMTIFIILMLALEHGLMGRLERRVFAWRPAHGL